MYDAGRGRDFFRAAALFLLYRAHLASCCNLNNIGRRGGQVIEGRANGPLLCSTVEQNCLKIDSKENLAQVLLRYWSVSGSVDNFFNLDVNACQMR